MPTRFETVIQTKATLAKALEYYTHPENLAKSHPDFIKEVKVTSREGDTINLEEHTEMMGRKLRMVNKMWLDRSTNTLHVDTLDGDGKGSKMTMFIRELPTGTEIHYDAAMEFGALGFFVKGRAKATFEKVAQEDKQQLDSP